MRDYTSPEPSTLFFLCWAISIVSPSLAPNNLQPSPIANPNQNRKKETPKQNTHAQIYKTLAAAAAAISVLLLQKLYRLHATTLILQSWQTEEQEENVEPSAVDSAAHAENAEDEVVAAVLAVMRRKNGSRLPSLAVSFATEKSDLSNKSTSTHSQSKNIKLLTLLLDQA
jgi:hypothetical protein